MTFTANIRGTRGKVKAMTPTAKQLTESLCRKATVIELRNIHRGRKYVRIVADIYIDDKSLADILIKNGLEKHTMGERGPNGHKPKDDIFFFKDSPPKR